MPNEQFTELGKQYASLQKRKADIARQEAEVKAKIDAIMGEYDEDSMEFGPVKAVKVAPKPANRFNQQEFKEAHPRLFKQFVKQGKAARPFIRLTKVNGGW